MDVDVGSDFRRSALSIALVSSVVVLSRSRRILPYFVHFPYLWSGCIIHTDDNVHNNANKVQGVSSVGVSSFGLGVSVNK